MTYYILHRKTRNTFDDIFISEQDVIDVLCNLDIKKANGPDGISHKLLKETSKSISKPLSIIFNRSIHENLFPSFWKEANVMPLFKKVKISFLQIIDLFLLLVVLEQYLKGLFSITSTTTYTQINLYTRISQVSYQVILLFTN